jgi:dipeptidyl aminopeptidase/acylaminoacyl peptidase
MELSIPRARQWLLHGTEDDTVPPAFSRDYAEQKKRHGEQVELVEIAHAGHYDVIDPRSEAFKKVKTAVLSALG